MRKSAAQGILLKVHRRLLAGDHDAREKLTQLLLEPLVQELSHRVQEADEHLIRDGVIDAIVAHCENPEKYDTDNGLPLDRFLAAAARRNVQDLLRSEHRRKRREREAGRKRHEADVALDPSATNSLQEEKARFEQEIQALMNALKEPKDREILRLRLEGVRATEAFARILEITHLPLKEQRKEVKRHKDRIQRFLIRHGFRLSFLS